VYAKLSARVGSISDNTKGGWYGYRAAKAALNMLLQTSAIELARKNPAAVIAALQPGTVQSPLSTPFVDQSSVLTALESVNGLLQALDQVGISEVAHQGAYFLD
jgi:NAD(P)-dependent dehydrogenase (short-subunit alcohol dehydrogenase family)